MVVDVVEITVHTLIVDEILVFFSRVIFHVVIGVPLSRTITLVEDVLES